MMHSIKSNGTYWKLLEANGRSWKLEHPYGTLGKPLGILGIICKAKTVNLVRRNTQTDRHTDPCIELRYAQQIITTTTFLYIMDS